MFVTDKGAEGRSDQAVQHRTVQRLKAVWVESNVVHPPPATQRAYAAKHVTKHLRRSKVLSPLQASAAREKSLQAGLTFFCLVNNYLVDLTAVLVCMRSTPPGDRLIRFSLGPIGTLLNSYA